MSEEVKSDNISASPTQDELDIKKKKLGPYNEIKEFNELYWGNKDKARQLKKRDEEFAEMKDLFFNLDERLDGLSPMPDAIDDPEAFKKRIREDAKRTVEREAKRTTQPNSANVSPPNVAPNRHTKEALNTMETVQRSLHPDDFDSVTKPVMDELQYNSVLVHKMFSSPDPAKAIYDYGKAIIDTDKQNTANRIAQGSVEGGSKSSELSGSTTKGYYCHGKLMTNAQVEGWKKSGLSMDKLTLKK